MTSIYPQDAQAIASRPDALRVGNFSDSAPSA